MARFYVENEWLRAEDLTPGSIDESIAKWEFLRDNTSEVRFVEWSGTCALCLAYVDEKCYECPIYAYTGYKFCGNTPFQQAADVIENFQRRAGWTDIARSATQAEIDFLKEVKEWTAHKDEEESQ